MHAENAFTPFLDPDFVLSHEIAALSRALTLAAVLAGLAVGAAWGLVVFKRGPEFARAIAIERPA